MRKKHQGFNPCPLGSVNPILPFPSGHLAVSRDLHGLWISKEQGLHPSCAIYSLSDAWAILKPLSFRDLTHEDEEDITGE